MAEEGGHKLEERDAMRCRIASTSDVLHATPPPSTTRVRSCRSAARAVFSTSVSISAS